MPGLIARLARLRRRREESHRRPITPREQLIADLTAAVVFGGMIALPLAWFAVIYVENFEKVNYSGAGPLPSSPHREPMWLPIPAGMPRAPAIVVSIWFLVGIVLLGVLRIARANAADDQAERSETAPTSTSTTTDQARPSQ